MGLLTRRQLIELGTTTAVRSRLVRDRALVPLSAAVFRVAGAPRSWDQEVLAATLDCNGPVSFITGATLQRLDGFEEEVRPIDVLVEHGHRNPRSGLARVRTTRSLPVEDRVVVRRRGAMIPCTSVPRTILSLAALVPALDPDRVIGALDGALRRGAVSEAQVWRHLERIRARGRNGVGVLEAALVRRAGGRVTESWLEREFLRVLADAGLPLPRCQLRIRPRGAFVARIDFAYDDPPIGIEVNGNQFHGGSRPQRADARRANALLVAGRPLLRFSYEDVVLDPGYVVRTVAAALGIPLPA